MKIGIDAKWLVQGPPAAKLVVQNLITKLLNIDKSNYYYLFLPSNSGLIDLNCINSNLTVVKFPLKNMFLRNVFLSEFYCWKYHLDILFTQYYNPVFSSTKRIVMVHDIIFESDPRFFTRIERIYFHLMAHTVKKAHYIVTVSYFVKNELIKYYSLPPDKIFVIYNAVSLANIPGHQSIDIKKKFNINSEYLLYLGRLNIRKNIPNLLRAFSLIKDKTDYSLVLAGKRDWKSENLETIIDNLNLKSKIIFTGFVTEEDKFFLIAQSRIFIYVPFIEGFGIPPLEAMSLGVPCVVSNTSSLPEVVGDAALLVDPNNVNEISQAILTLLNNKELYKQYSRKGIARASRFSWENSATKLLKLFKKVNV